MEPKLPALECGPGLLLTNRVGRGWGCLTLRLVIKATAASSMSSISLLFSVSLSLHLSLCLPLYLFSRCLLSLIRSFISVTLFFSLSSLSLCFSLFFLSIVFSLSVSLFFFFSLLSVSDSLSCFLISWFERSQLSYGAAHVPGNWCLQPPARWVSSLEAHSQTFRGWQPKPTAWLQPCGTCWVRSTLLSHCLILTCRHCMLC